MSAVTQFQPGGWPGRLYGSFAGRAAVHLAVTQLQCGAWGGMRYGGFAGKTPYNPPANSLIQRVRNRQGGAPKLGFV